MRLDIIPERPCLPVGEVTSLPVLLRLTAPSLPQMVRKPLNLCLVIDRSGSTALCREWPQGHLALRSPRGESEEGRRSTPLGRVRGEGQELAGDPARARAFPANEAARGTLEPRPLSMAGEKLRQTIASAKFVVERLAPTDILSVVQFDERVKVVIPPGPVADRAHLCRRLDGIHVGGQTNLSGGWLRGAACVREKASSEFVNRVILLTDGQANQGITDPEVLVKHAAELIEEGIATTTLGYGEDFHEDLLTALADAGRGNAYHVETADQASGIFAKELEGLLGIAAQNVRMTITPHTLVRRVDLCSAVEHERTGRSLTVTLGDLVSEDTRSVLLTFRVDAPQHDGWVGLGKITVSYDDVVGGITVKTLTHDLLVGAMAPEKVAAIPADAVVVREFLILRAGKVLQAAIAQADAGDVKGAIQRLSDFLAAPEVAASTDPEIQAARRRIKETLHDLQDRGFNTMNRKQMLYCSRGWSVRRGGSAT